MTNARDFDGVWIVRDPSADSVYATGDRLVFESQSDEVSKLSTDSANSDKSPTDLKLEDGELRGETDALLFTFWRGTSRPSVNYAHAEKHGGPGGNGGGSSDPG